MPLTLDNILEYEEATSGDCIVGVPEVSSKQDSSLGHSCRITVPLIFLPFYFSRKVRVE